MGVPIHMSTCFYFSKIKNIFHFDLPWAQMLIYNSLPNLDRLVHSVASTIATVATAQPHCCSILCKTKACKTGYITQKANITAQYKLTTIRKVENLDWSGTDISALKRFSYISIQKSIKSKIVFKHKFTKSEEWWLQGLNMIAGNC